jgi:hypothetical protein
VSWYPGKWRPSLRYRVMDRRDGARHLEWATAANGKQSGRLRANWNTAASNRHSSTGQRDLSDSFVSQVARGSQ